MASRGIWEISVYYSQLCYEPTPDLKVKSIQNKYIIFFKKGKDVSHIFNLYLSFSRFSIKVRINIFFLKISIN